MTKAKQNEIAVGLSEHSRTGGDCYGCPYKNEVFCHHKLCEDALELLKAQEPKDGKVYIITKGEYSDYHICAVTMDKNRAERLKRLLDEKCHEANIEEYIPDEVKEGGRLYFVEFPDNAHPKIGFDEYDGFGNFNDSPCVADWFDPIRVYVRSKDEAHAMKIAQDEYAKYKAERVGL